jgi:hypothetical protein
MLIPSPDAAYRRGFKKLFYKSVKMELSKNGKGCTEKAAQT